jgi:RNA polymerase sigma-70 factor, ECF subfamily
LRPNLAVAEAKARRSIALAGPNALRPGTKLVMFRRAGSIRRDSDFRGGFPFDGEAALASVSGLAGAGIPGGSIGGSVQPVALARAGASGSGHNPSEKADSGRETPSETARKPQPSDQDRVPEDMATMVLNGPALGAQNDALHSAASPRPDLDPTSDAAIMLRVAEGDEAGFTYLAEKYHRPMIHFLYRMVGNHAVAEELAQEVFLRVYRARTSYRAEARFTTWLYRIATNLAVNHARDTKHERSAQTVYLDAPDEETGTTPDLADDDPSVEERMLRDERMAAIRKHVMALPERQRMAVLMHKYQGMDYRQIGEVLKLSESATKSLLFRAYQTLREKLKDFV